MIPVAVLIGGCAASRSSSLIGQAAPLSRVTQLDGDVTTLESFLGKGRPTVLAFWATSCSLSPRAIERVNDAAKRLKPLGVQFLAISIDKAETLPTLRSMVQYRRMSEFTHFFSGNDVYDEAYISYKGDEIPYFLVIDGKGTVVASGHKPSVVEESFKIR
ncbi:MAG: TlpA family protein disulfide reductase [Proteobacteria bacterium]|nr:TlpA family protein disulfide reductase [Pseudomonadota bacterium]